MANSIFRAFHRFGWQEADQQFIPVNQSAEEVRSGERLQSEIDKILVRASVVTGLFMGLISLLLYEEIDVRPEPKVALFSFGMAFIFTLLIWMVNIYINNRRGLSFVYQFIRVDYEFSLRILICLLISTGLLRLWAGLDVFYQMENMGTSNFAGVLQVRGLLIVAFSLITTWGVEKALAQQQAMGLISKLKEENFQAKYEVLKQQINPHFLFNSLNILKGMIRTRNEDAEEYLIRLADVYRYILQSNAKQDVVLADELLMLESYHYMLKNRFRDAIDLIIDLSPETRRSVVPPLTFQMLMENCVKHNVLTQSRKLYVSISEQNDMVLFRNNLQPKQSLQSANHIGLENMTRRYEHLCGQPLRVEQNDQFFTVYLPIISPDYDRSYSGR